MGQWEEEAWEEEALENEEDIWEEEEDVFDFDFNESEPMQEEQEFEEQEQDPELTGFTESDEQLSFEEEDSEPIDYDIGVPVDIEELQEESYNVVGTADNTFISSTGDIVVQDKNDTGDNFKLIYVDIADIAVVGRIRATKNVDTLVQSIKSTGLLEPIVVAPLETKGLYVLIHGYRRIIACAKSGITRIPCVVNNKISTTDIPILEALYNHSKQYSIKEVIDYIEYLEKEKGILSASMIEYLLQMPSGDYTKLKDILNDDDEDIVSQLMNDQITIGQAFKKLEARRKKESKEEQELKKSSKVYVEGTEDGTTDKIAGSGEEGDNDSVLTDEEISKLSISATELHEVANKDLDEMVEESKKMEGFEPNKQDYKNREILDPALRKAVLARDNNTCQCCGLTGQEYMEVFDIHHIVEVYLGGSDDIDNLVTTCVICHKLIHLGARGELFIRPSEEMTEEEKAKFKKILALSGVIRKGMAQKNMKKGDLKKVDKAETIGRTKPGTSRQVAT